jgi:hypothetical protein
MFKEYKFLQFYNKLEILGWPGWHIRWKQVPSVLILKSSKRWLCRVCYCAELRMFNCHLHTVFYISYCLCIADKSGHQKLTGTKSLRSSSSRPWLFYPRLAQCYRARPVPIMDFVHPSDDFWTSREFQVEPLWPH